MMKPILLSFLMIVPFAAQATCFAEAADRYVISESLLRAIAQVESSGRPEAMNLSHRKRTGTYDIGMMQVNSSWLPKLAKMGIDEKMLMEPCQNVMVGAWILAHHLREAGAGWNGVGAYNASCRTLTPEQCQAARNTYAWKVYRALTGKTATPRRLPVPTVAASAPAGVQRRISSVVIEDAHDAPAAQPQQVLLAASRHKPPHEQGVDDAALQD